MEFRSQFSTEWNFYGLQVLKSPSIFFQIRQRYSSSVLSDLWKDYCKILSRETYKFKSLQKT